MECKKCGNILEDDDIFCGKCGTSIDGRKNAKIEPKPDLIDKLSTASGMGVAFIITSIVCMIILVVAGILINDLKNVLIWSIPLCSLFMILGIAMTKIFKQNVHVVAIIIFLSVGIVLACYAPITGIKGMYAGLFIGILGATIAFIDGKRKNKLKFYKPAKVEKKTPREELLNRCVNDLTDPNYPVLITTEGNWIVASIDWKNTTRFTFTSITNEQRSFEYRVFLNDNYTYTEQMNSISNELGVKPGNITFETSAFSGIELRDYGSIEFGINNNTGETGLITTKFDTEEIRDRIRTYVEKHGYKYK